MQVLLKEDVENLGLAGEVHKVADGYGRNYLLPRGLAVKATSGALKQAESWRERAATRRAEIRREYETLAAKISGVQLVFTAKAGSKGKLYGSITTADVADRLNQMLGTEIDRRKFEGEPMRQMGEHQVVIRLNSEYQPMITVLVQPEGAAAPAVSEAAVEEPALEEPAVEEPAIEEPAVEEPAAEELVVPDAEAEAETVGDAA
jgi:large subunit ribosomal protein L9